MFQDDTRRVRAMSARPEGPIYQPADDHYGHRGAYDPQGTRFSPGEAAPTGRHVWGARYGSQYEDGHGYTTDYRHVHPDSRPASPGFAGKGPAGYRRADDRIADDLYCALTDDAGLDASEIEISVTGGEVVLQGTAFNRNQRRRADDIAHMIPGVTHVQNNLRIRAGGLHSAAYVAD
jgi:hypothetical protein